MTKERYNRVLSNHVRHREDEQGMTIQHLSQEKAKTDEKDLGGSRYNKQKVS